MLINLNLDGGKSKKDLPFLKNSEVKISRRKKFEKNMYSLQKVLRGDANLNFHHIRSY
jgi:hypothetical protein